MYFGEVVMSLKEQEYIVKIAEEGNLTRAAEKLFVTPSALTQHINNLEQELGTPLFFRSRSGCVLTAAGEIYVKNAYAMLRMQKEAYDRIHDIVAIKQGTLTVGFPPERGVDMFTSIYPAFHRAYPNIVINIRETSVRQQQQFISKGIIDIGFLTLTSEQQTDDEHIFIKSEEFAVAVPSKHPLCQNLSFKKKDSFPILTIQELKFEPFALMYKESTAREVADKICRQAGFFPEVLFETSRGTTIQSMCAANLCCSILPGYYANKSSSNITYFHLPDHPSWNLMASYRKDSYLTKPARFFIELATNYWKIDKKISDNGPEAPHGF